MKLIAWNCRGLGTSLTIHSLLDLQKGEDLDILFLSETKMNEKRTEGPKVEAWVNKFGGKRLQWEEWWSYDLLKKGYQPPSSRGFSILHQC